MESDGEGGRPARSADKEFEDRRYSVDLDDFYSVSGFLRVMQPGNGGATVGYVTGRSLMAKFQLSPTEPRVVLHDDAFDFAIEVELRQSIRELRGRVFVRGETPPDAWTVLADW